MEFIDFDKFFEQLNKVNNKGFKDILKTTESEVKQALRNRSLKDIEQLQNKISEYANRIANKKQEV